MQGQPTTEQFRGSQVRLTYFEWRPQGAEHAAAPTVLLVHATGFHARCWDRTVAALPEGFRVVAVDMRGHGRSERLPPYQWRSFGRDLEELVEALDLQDAIGVGHSMGGHCVTHAAARLPHAFSRLLLVDPVILDPHAYGREPAGLFATAEDSPVARRRNEWTSWQQMFERFADRHPFSLWRPEVLEDYCRYGVLPRPQGGFELACPPLVEASIYMNNASSDLHQQIPDIDLPVVVLRAMPRTEADDGVMDFTKSPTWPALAQEFPQGRDVFLPHLTHFIPMQDPELVARFIADPDCRE